MKTTSFIKVALMLAFGTLAGRAQTTQVDQWTVWPTASYTSVDASVGDGVLTTTNGSSVSYDTGYIYTFFATPTLTLSTGALDNVSSITLEILIAGGSGDIPFLAGPTLDFGSGTDLPATANINLSGGDIFGNPASSYSYTWDVTGLTAGESVGISWQLNSHAAVGSVTLTQSTAAVPEPAAFASILGAFTLASVAIRRRPRKSAA